MDIISTIEEKLKIKLIIVEHYGSDPVSRVMPHKSDQHHRCIFRNEVLIGLNLSYSKLTDILWREIIEHPDFKAECLEALNLRSNKLSKSPIPEKMANLKYLDLCDNDIKELTIPSVHQLKYLGIRGNKSLTIPPVEVVKKGDIAILNYFREREVQGTIKLYEAKMLLVGEGGSGKTSLLRRLFQKELPLPEENESTKGIEIFSHEFLMDDGNTFRLNVWDFGGQDIYHATHQFFLTKRSLYILLDDTRKDHKTVHDEGFKYWLEVIDLLSDHSPVLIFQNEKSGRSKEIDMAGIKGRFDNVKERFRGNLEFPDAANHLGEAIEYFAKNLPHIGQDLPAKWVSIRAEVETIGQAKPYITDDEYFEVYGRHLEFNTEKALFLSQYLHDLGVFLHFQDDPLLTRTVILQNTWATEAVFKMLDDETVKGNLGRFVKTDCVRVWHDSHYAKKHLELLALMQKFELCYLLRDTRPDTWLVPQLLPPSKPQELINWEQPGDLLLRYKYEFLPKGLINRLMVRMHRFVPRPDMGWRTGVLFEREDTLVLVEIPPQGGEITLRARGHDRKQLLYNISSDLDAINDTFHGLQEKVSKWVPCNCRDCRKMTQPHSYNFENLRKRKKAGKLTVECENSYEQMDVNALLDGVIIKYNNKEIIQNLLNSGKLKEALEYLQDEGIEETTDLLGQLAHATSMLNEGRFSNSDYKEVFNRVMAAARQFLSGL